jgi:hypothetical protein
VVYLIYLNILVTVVQYFLQSKILLILALDFYVYIQMDYSKSRHIKHIYQILYEFINYLKRILILVHNK